MEQKDQPALPGLTHPSSSDLKGPSKAAKSDKRLRSDKQAFDNGTVTCHKLLVKGPSKSRPQFCTFGAGPVAGMRCEEGYKRVGDDCVMADIGFDD